MDKRKQFWSQAWNSASDQTKYMVDRPYCKAFNLTNDNLKMVNDLVFKIIYNSMRPTEQKSVDSDQDHKGIIDCLSTTTIFAIDVVNQLDSFVELEKTILESFRQQKFLTELTAIQFPVDIRVVHPAPPPNYLEKRKAVDFLHTDAWRGEPPDVVNCVLYCAVNDKASQLVVYDVPLEGIDTFVQYAGLEKEATYLIANLPEVTFYHRPGEAIFFDAYTPHHTRRNGDEVRISLNFSFRRGDPYETLDERWERSEQPWGKYWYFPPKPLNSFAERCQTELNQLTQFGQNEALIRRQSVIDKLGIPRKLEELYV